MRNSIQICLMATTYNAKQHPKACTAFKLNSTPAGVNDGTGKFTKSIGFGSKGDSTIDVEIADIDDNNDLILPGPENSKFSCPFFEQYNDLHSTQSAV